MSWFERSGLILFTENYREAVGFYRDVLELRVEEEKEGLTRFTFGSGYLMVETGGHAAADEKTRAQSPVTLRFNVFDVEKAAAMLRARGVPVTIRHWSWGITGHFRDPDNNRLELKDHPF